MMSRYPDTATLAAFRRSIAYNRDGQAHATALAFGYVPEHHGIPGAHDYELQRGIGYGDGRSGRGYIASGYIDARREASALRSRAYARGIGSLADVQTFAPSSWNPYIDGERECTHDDPCEVGCIGEDFWEDEEPRRPLPVIYHQSISIAPTA